MCMSENTWMHKCVLVGMEAGGHISYLIFFKRSPTYCLRQDLSLNEELTILQDQLASEVPSSGVTDVSSNQTQIRSVGHSPD